MSLKIRALLSMYALMAASIDQKPQIRINVRKTNEELLQAEIERYKSQGLTEFYYGENSLWALNQKSADKKAKKRGLRNYC